MGVVSFLRNTAKLFAYRHQVVEFLRFCDDPNSSFCGCVQPEELPYLRELVQNANAIPGPIIEVGTLYGFTTQHMAAAKDPEKRLITIDNFSWNAVGMDQEAHRQFCRRSLFYLTQRCQTEIFDGTSASFYESYDGSTPSMVFIDAFHSYEEVIKDIRWAVSKNVPIVSGHDYGMSWPGVKKAVDECFGSQVRVVGSLWAHVRSR